MEDKKRELIDCFIKMMTPAAGRIHQSLVFNLSYNIRRALEDCPCKIYLSPFDVRLPNNKKESEDKKVYTVVQPDVSIICDLTKLDEKGCIGAPDFIAEIVSPGSVKKDIEEKFRLYEKHGVREYWIIFPESKSVHVFVLDETGKYRIAGMFAEDSLVRVNIFKDLVIELKEIFKD